MDCFYVSKMAIHDRAPELAVYPALGNHDLKGNEATAPRNYFQRFPALHNSRYYSVRAANCLLLILDSSLNEVVGAQGDWLKDNLSKLPSDVKFLFVVLHHPPYTSSSDEKKYGGGHSARHSEGMLATLLEQRQQAIHQRVIVIGGHVHNDERHEHGGVIYFVTGGGGAHAYPIERAQDDPFQSNEINYHYLDIAVSKAKVEITMKQLQLIEPGLNWTTPDEVTIPAFNAVSAQTSASAGRPN